MILRTILAFGLLLLSAGAGPAVSQQGAMPEIRKTIDEVVKVNQQIPGATRRQKLREVIQPRFDFQEMAKRSLGAQWQAISSAEQSEFQKVFSDVLANTYLSRIETVGPDTVRLDSENLDFPRSVVKTTVKASNETFPIDYKLMNQDGQWRVYDVVIENIGLVANYRNEFNGIIRREKFSGLMERLREKAKTQQ